MRVPYEVKQWAKMAFSFYVDVVTALTLISLAFATVGGVGYLIYKLLGL